ncbi:MAG TPA: OB-fold domain-containing protein [Alphaproteobacteria bacterium]
MSGSEAQGEPGPEAAYFAHLARGEFAIQHCDGCARWVFYPRIACPHCGGRALTFQRPSGRGVVYATSVVRPRPEQGAPYNVALIDLDEGPRMMGRIEGVAPEAVGIGLKVVAEVDTGGATPVVVFRAAKAER